MRGYNIIVVFDESAEQVLMCRRQKPPYMGLSNFVGGAIEDGEDGITAAYRELFEETAITRDDVTLTHLMDHTYYAEDYYLEVYVGRLNKFVRVHGDENELYWSGLDENFLDTSKYAGRGLVGHIMLQIEAVKDKLLK